MELESLKTLFAAALDELYGIEQRLVRLVMEMANESTEPQLKKRFELHYEQTYDQLMRLERMLRTMKVEPTGTISAGMLGIISDTEEVVVSDGAAKDALLLSAALRIEHYEIACYSAAVSYAQVLGETASARILQRTLDEETLEEKQLAALASVVVTRRASSYRRKPFHVDSP